MVEEQPITKKGTIIVQQWEPGIFTKRIDLGFVPYCDDEGDPLKGFEDGDKVEVIIRRARASKAASLAG